MEVVFYKICCDQNTLCSDGFIGYTSKLSQKKYFHKKNCANAKKTCTLYTTIREHGGWKNWGIYKIDTKVCSGPEEINIIVSDLMNNFKYTLSICENVKQYTCTCCQMEFKDKFNLERHYRSPGHVRIIETQNSSNDTVIELAKQVIDLSKNNITVTNNTNNNYNNTVTNHFNLNVFLNETCKNAINFNDFVARLNPQLNELIYTGETDYASGISNIMVNGLNSLDTHERPIHCSDVKRETLYIKNNNKWQKDTIEHEQLLDAVRKVGRKNVKTIDKWKEDNPDYYKYDSKENTTYMRIIGNCMPGCTDKEIENANKKIIRNIANSVSITK